MSPAQRAIVAKAKNEGLLPMQIAPELLLHDLVQTCLDQLKGQQVLFKQQSEKQQDVTIANLQTELRAAVTLACDIIAAQGSTVVPMTLDKLATGKALTITGKVDTSHPGRYELMDRVDNKSEVLIILSPREYDAGLDAIQGEKDQKPLNLDGPENTSKSANQSNSAKRPKADKAPPKIKDGELDKARSFVTEFKNTTIPGLQQQLKCGVEKATALLDLLVEEGVLIFVGDDASGEYQIPASTTGELVNESPVGDGANGEFHADDLEADSEGLTIFSEELVTRARAKTIKDQDVSAAGLAITFDTTSEVAQQIVDRLELDGVISAESDLGFREILVTE